MKHLISTSLVFVFTMFFFSTESNACVGTYYACESEMVEFSAQALANCTNGTIEDLTIVVIKCDDGAEMASEQ